MPIDRFYVILNPTAGRGAAARVRGVIEREMAQAGAAFTIAETARRGHAAELAEAAAREGWPAVVAVGGDGTVHEVVNGLMRAANGGPSVPLGIVGVGSGNDFARLAGVPTDAAWAVRRLTEAEPRPVDVGRVGDEWFSNGVGIGLDARVAIEVDRRRRFRGLAMYLHALAGVLRAFRPPRMTVELDGVRVAEGPMTLVTIGNVAEGTWLDSVADTYSTSQWWTGLNDLSVEDTFEWADGTRGEINDLVKSDLDFALRRDGNRAVLGQSRELVARPN